MAKRKAFLLRIAPGGRDMVTEALEKDQLIIGWAEAKGLLDPALDRNAFREVLHRTYHAEDKHYRGAGKDASTMWPFVREMSEGDLVVVPSGAGFYVAEVTGSASHDSSRVVDDSAYRRPARWLNGKQPIPRVQARAALVSRMKVRNTCVDISEFVEEIEELLGEAATGKQRTFDHDLREILLRKTIDEIRSGRMDSYKFEALVAAVLRALRAKHVEIVGRRIDKGADILAVFTLAGKFDVPVAVQIKHYQPEPPAGREPVEQLLRGMAFHGVSHGIVVTSGAFSEEAFKCAREAEERNDVSIEFIDGDELAALLIDEGLAGRTIVG